MIKKICEFLEGIPMTALSGVFLVVSFVLSHTGVSFPVDPAWVTVAVSGFPILCSAVRKVLRKPGIEKISSSLLITVAMIAAVCIGDFFAAGEVAFIMAVGEILEDKTTDRAKRGLSRLVGLAPTVGRRLTEDGEEIISAEDIRVGDRIRILPGEAVPVDGTVICGETSVDQSVITGESLPVDKGVGDSLFCGTVNRFGAVDIVATSVGEDSSFRRLIRMVRQAEEKRAPMARTADRAAAILVPLALVVAAATWALTGDIVRAVTVLVVFCPCALVLATPTAIMAAIGQAAHHGVIIKSGEALEAMGKVDAVAFDKTGTITEGRLSVSEVIPLGEASEEELLTLAASAEGKSEHPLGRAVVDLAKERGMALADCEDFLMRAGNGIIATVEGRRVICGSENFLASEGVSLGDEALSQLEGLRGQGKAAILVAADGICIGVVGFSDVIREGAAAAVASLGKMGVQSVLLTGDNSLTAAHFAAVAGIGEVHSSLLPEMKVERIEKMRGEGKVVAMIGDGVNDAPALKAASVGIAMGSMGSDIATEAADIALMGDDISKVPYLRRLAVSTVRTVRLGITLSMVINIGAVVLSVLGLLGPTTGALVHNGGAIAVVLIAAMLYDRKF